METRSNHILVGGVVLGMLLAVILFIVWLSNWAGSSDKEFDVLFGSVEGLAKGSQVTYSGVPVGQVKEIELPSATNPGRIRVRITVKSDTPVLERTSATIKGVGFTGVSQIQLDPPELKPGQPRPPELKCPTKGQSPKCPFGVPLIATKQGALGELLNSAPKLLENVSELTANLNRMLSPANRQSIADILKNLSVISRNLAERSDEIASTMADARIAIRQTGDAVEEMGRLAATSNDVLDRDARPLISDLRRSVRAAEVSMGNLDAAIAEARPGLQAFSKQTIPEVGQLVRDLREMSDALSAVSQRLDQQGAMGIVSGQTLPDYKPRKK
jgi:phospholipid/cholesterol/gamma-HCH transport system substrate-binding protein